MVDDAYYRELFFETYGMTKEELEALRLEVLEEEAFRRGEVLEPKPKPPCPSDIVRQARQLEREHGPAGQVAEHGQEHER